MGMVTINMQGSFTRTGCTQFSAQDGGHAQCIQKAITHLASQLPAAIERDHELHDKGTRPGNANFGRG